ncbi:MAG TPA: SMC-Scp complex subunit ScpB [Caldisericia bacterium]|nr:SMC-Scp complex subunit ScpB [Caldisericia bacterium]HPF48384.1 SMC-Scp complex subunit ScpB [Caldisericia bacterium]HPI83437.1 SMC-Scp complex subunit ScpB [Caldisericia bacterium]HPQ92838.1 SMC-Scp complex subunit ScpB [Caldisericia bacterium]HRV74065.1 SMC-Scp complex subunit ScpB [Caldisericia bacterium]
MNLINALEAVLFVSHKPITFHRIAKLIGCYTGEVPELLDKLMDRYEDRGIVLKIRDDRAQLLSHPDYEEIVKPLKTQISSKRMTKAAIETLAIIASKGEATKAQITKYRGTTTDNTIDGLVSKGLLERFEKRTAGKRVKVFFKVTPKFRKLAGLSDTQELKIKFESLLDDDREESLFDDIDEHPQDLEDGVVILDGSESDEDYLEEVDESTSDVTDSEDDAEDSDNSDDDTEDPVDSNEDTELLKDFDDSNSSDELDDEDSASTHLDE